MVSTADGVALDLHPRRQSDKVLRTGTAFSMRVLYLEGSSCKYGASAEKKKMLDQLCSAISNLSTEQCISVLQVGQCPCVCNMRLSTCI